MANAAKDVVSPVSDTATIQPAMSARLCNFVTGESFLLQSHVTWLDNEVQRFIRSSPNPWVDILGFASRKTGPPINQPLSERRCQAVRSWIDNYSERTKFNIQVGFGDTLSDGPADNDDGWWRAVIVKVYGTRPPHIPEPKPVIAGTKFKIRIVANGSLGSEVLRRSVEETLKKMGRVKPPKIPIGASVNVDTVIFEIAEREGGLACFYLYAGLSAYFGLDIPQIPNPFSKVPLLKKLNLGLPSEGGIGPWKNFETTQSTNITDFAGSAAFYQNPSLGQLGSWSPNDYLVKDLGKVYLTFYSSKLDEKMSIVKNQPLELAGGSGFQLPQVGLSAGHGTLTLLTAPVAAQP